MEVRKGTQTTTAVFENEAYSSDMEAGLVRAGFFAVAIKDPLTHQIFQYPEFALAPEWIRWVMPAHASAEAWIDALGSNHDRYKLRKKLRKAASQDCDVRIEIRALTANDYALWHDTLYLPEIVNKPGGIRYWPKPSALSKKLTLMPSGEVSDFYRIFMYENDGSLIGGSLWSLSPSESCLTIRAAAFEKKARAKYELAIRGMEESRLFALSRGLKWLSYGTDINFYGVDTTIGLQMFKASIGMKPVLARIGSVQLIKILDRPLKQIHSAATGHPPQPSVLIFAFGGSDMSKKLHAFQRLPPRKKRGDLDFLWNEDMGLVPLRFVVESRTVSINVPGGMILQDIVL